MTTADKLHTQLEEKAKDQRFDVIEDIGLYLKVHLKDKNPPCTVTFIYDNKEDRKFVDVWYSTETREPRAGLGAEVGYKSAVSFILTNL